MTAQLAFPALPRQGCVAHFSITRDLGLRSQKLATAGPEGQDPWAPPQGSLHCHTAPHSTAPALRHHNTEHARKGVTHGRFQGDPLVPPQGACLPVDTLTGLKTRRQHTEVSSSALTQRQHALTIARHGDR